jgi:signal transduction histidine kinase
MNLRAKLFPALVAACVALLVLLCFTQYRRSLRAAQESLRADTEWRAAQLARLVEKERRARADEIFELATSQPLDDFFVRLGIPESAPARRAAATAAQPLPGAATELNLSNDLLSHVRSFFARHGEVYTAVTLVTGAGDRIVARIEPPRVAGETPVVKTGEFVLSGNGLKGVLSDSKSPPSGAGEAEHGNAKWAITSRGALACAAPVVWEREGPIGTLVAELKPDALVALAAEGLADAGGARAQGGDGRAPLFQIVALDGAGRIVYHTLPAFHFQTVAGAMPYFNTVASEMTAARRGETFFDGAEGERWLAAYEPVKGLDLSVAVVANETAATAGLRREGSFYVALALATALAAVGLVLVRERRAARRIERVARAAQAVAAGNLDERLDVSAHDRTRAIAESFNLMTDRLREHLRRESENRQFQAFMRLSATLTHDLKNAITGLSMLVSNMERQFHREEFRADAVTSLREATDKLRGLVARLNKPVETLSGEYRSALKPVDLVPLVRRAVEGAGVRSQFHEIEARLPDALEAFVDAERVERVVENLVINALEAMGKNAGRLTVEAGREGDDKIFIAVADTGPGMSQEFIRARLFQPFSTTKTQGLGLGLYTCREVVEAHGGRIEVESRRTSGTRFRVVLPSRPVSLPRATGSGSMKN